MQRVFIVIAIILITSISLMDFFMFQGRYRELAESVLVELHGILFDVVLFLLIIGLIEQNSRSKREVSIAKWEIESTRFWSEVDRVKTLPLLIKRINENRCFDIVVNGLGLSKLYLSKNITLIGASFNDCDLSDAKFDGLTMLFTSFRNSDLRGVVFSNLESPEDIANRFSESAIKTFVFKNSSFKHYITHNIFLDLEGSKVSSSNFLKNFDEMNISYSKYISPYFYLSEELADNKGAFYLIKRNEVPFKAELFINRKRRFIYQIKDQFYRLFNFTFLQTDI